MSRYSKKSKIKLMSCDAVLRDIMLDVDLVIEATIIEGHRPEETQNEYFNTGRSKVKFPNSAHNKILSKAVDASPFPIPKNWGIGNAKEMAKFYLFAGVVKGVALKHGRQIRWGGDWDNDNDFDDQTFDDLVHFELIPLGDL